MAATRINSAGKVVLRRARLIVDEAFLEWLAEHLERLAIEFGHFVEKKDAFMGFGDLAGLGR